MMNSLVRYIFPWLVDVKRILFPDQSMLIVLSHGEYSITDGKKAKIQCALCRKRIGKTTPN